MPDQQLALFGPRPPARPTPRPALPPHRHDSDTSREAAAAVKAHAETQLANVVAFIRAQGARAATNEEIDDALHIGVNCVCARTNEAKARGLIRRSTIKRRGASGLWHRAWEGA